jgi:hypothetical protein
LQEGLVRFTVGGAEAKAVVEKFLNALNGGDLDAAKEHFKTLNESFAKS